MGRQQIFQIRLTFGVAGRRRGKSLSLEDVRSRIIGEEYLTGLKSSCRCKGAPTGETGIVGQIRRVAVMAR